MGDLSTIIFLYLAFTAAFIMGYIYAKYEDYF